MVHVQVRVVSEGDAEAAEAEGQQGAASDATAAAAATTTAAAAGAAACGGVGELWCRGPTVFSGAYGIGHAWDVPAALFCHYYGAPPYSARVFVPHMAPLLQPPTTPLSTRRYPPFAAAGYWRRPAATREAFAPGGWFRTGDLALMPPPQPDTTVEAEGAGAGAGGRAVRGYLHVVDRKKDMVGG